MHHLIHQITTFVAKHGFFRDTNSFFTNQDSIKLQPRISELSKRPNISNDEFKCNLPKSWVATKEQEFILERSTTLIPPVLPIGNNDKGSCVSRIKIFIQGGVLNIP
jgi:hypothetical protein